MYLLCAHIHYTSTCHHRRDISYDANVPACAAVSPDKPINGKLVTFGACRTSPWRKGWGLIQSVHDVSAASRPPKLYYSLQKWQPYRGLLNFTLLYYCCQNHCSFYPNTLGSYGPYTVWPLVHLINLSSKLQRSTFLARRFFMQRVLLFFALLLVCCSIYTISSCTKQFVNTTGVYTLIPSCISQKSLLPMGKRTRQKCIVGRVRLWP